MKRLTAKPLSIGRVARRAGVGVETVRFYERQGLIEEPPRRMSGYREYDEDVVSRLGFIRRAKELGFTLKEIKELLSLRRDPSTPAADQPSRRCTMSYSRWRRTYISTSTWRTTCCSHGCST